MTLRLGFVGCGKWARKLAEAFRACGAELVAHDRRSPMIVRGEAEPVPGFGKFMPWRHQIADDAIDVIVAVAPPEITTEVALACAGAGKPVMATKPLARHPERITAPFFLDFVRLWSDAHARPRELRYELYGAGPFRSFPGGLDYGPHIMAALLDKGPTIIADCRRLPTKQGELFAATMSCNGEAVRVMFGNGSMTGVRNIWGYEETPLVIGSEPREAVMRKMCSSFLEDVSSGFADPRYLRLSREGLELLASIRGSA